MNALQLAYQLNHSNKNTRFQVGMLNQSVIILTMAVYSMEKGLQVDMVNQLSVQGILLVAV